MKIKTYLPLYATGLFLLVFFFIVKNDPFFGDAISTVSRAAVTMYEEDLRTAWYLPQHDPGHPTLFPYTLAVLWKVFGKTLWIAHLLTCFISFFVLLLVYRITVFFAGKDAGWISLLLMACSALFISQSAMVLTHLPLTLFFLLCIYALLHERKWLFIASAVLMFYTHLEASFLFLGIGVADWLIQRRKMSVYRWLRTRFLWYALPLIAFSIWVTAHYIHSGWALLSPNYMGHRTPALFISFLLNMLLVGWRLLDYGHFILFIPFIFGWKSKIPLTLMVLCITITLILSACVAYFLDNSIAHRYFLPVWTLLVILNAGWISRQDTLKKTLLVSMYAFVLVSGSFWYYPGKCLGDATIAYRRYFDLSEQIKKDLGTQRLYSYAPLSSPGKYTWLDEQKGLNLAPLYDVRMDTVAYVLGSSFTCELSGEQEEMLQKWHAKSYESGFVHATVYANPARVAKPSGWIRRTPGKAELWMSSLKQWIRERKLRDKR